ncbi:MBOAT family O-acyltransferase [Butyrivibrio sp. YAB3001]|uniref:MBOAT family O-acyltransferase n=1 Tax=Butyrivibrio sp. YAB3001 TaxID=1520812 RepID=UPI0008F642C7|nr:MBOAT family O-acyltransferase [Butyrivibrio sp. YAB3001]SFB76663.1 D-alanyl-lipoteichoic acid acyltransferase DltB, MBOAT superfamily [Butyrivibrio sp. YAB3001]
MLLQATTIIYIILLFLTFHIFPANLRKYILLLGSIIFIYLEGGNYGLLVLLAVTVITWGVGVLFFDEKKNIRLQKFVSCVTIAALSLLLLGWKYIPWIAQQKGLNTAPIPIGLSFYTFQAISYIEDLYMGKLAPERDPLKYALYMMWFPKWMSGPIERAGDFALQIEKCGNTRVLDLNHYIRSVTYLSWGLFMKLVIADRIGIVVDTVFLDISSYGSVTLILASLLYTIQIYCDFAGYTNIMIGISVLFGLELTQNFKTPYFSESTVVFWRRWHISLSNFLRDYVYIPLGGNRHGNVRKMINTLVVFLICGMWHGAGLSFIIWGLWHGICNVLANLIKGTKLDFLIKGTVGKIITFCLVSFAWIFFRADSLSQALMFIKGMIPLNTVVPITSGLEMTESAMLGISSFEWWIVLISFVLLFILDYMASRQKTIPPEMIITGGNDYSRAVFLSLIVLFVLIFGKYGSGADIRRFVYMQF